ncbi:hypothetical protein [Glycomyces tenuis]|uniref:hypothetical protein n=1 Tax=Glycomyces tenuis TaxID=58116 RepID=UPI0012DC980C|nr:hypothetical protein [Glycomyces tenuis]
MAAHDSGDRALGKTLLATDDDENAATRRLIDTLDLASTLVSADAVHCCVETAQVVLDRGIDYLLCCKDNRPELFAAVDALPGEGHAERAGAAFVILGRSRRHQPQRHRPALLLRQTQTAQHELAGHRRRERTCCGSRG